jgi:hypothetical protein
LLQGPVGAAQDLGVGRQILRTINLPSTSLGNSWEGEGILSEVSRKKRGVEMELLDFSRELDRILDRLKDRSGISKISLNVGFHDRQESSLEVKNGDTCGESRRSLAS